MPVSKLSRVPLIIQLPPASRKSDQPYLRRVVFDFDGVLHRRPIDATHEHWPSGPPIPGAAAAVWAFHRGGWEVVLMTASLSGAGLDAPRRRERLHAWLAEHEFPLLGCADEKPPAMLYIDDRGYRFDGSWTKLVNFLKRTHGKPHHHL